MAANELAALIRRVVRKNPQAAIVLGEILGPPAGAEGAPPRPWET